MPMPLTQWEAEIRPVLDRVASGAHMAERNALLLTARVAWETVAESDLRHAETALATALAAVRRALETYRSKGVEQ